MFHRLLHGTRSAPRAYQYILYVAAGLAAKASQLAGSIFSPAGPLWLYGVLPLPLSSLLCVDRVSVVGSSHKFSVFYVVAACPFTRGLRKYIYHYEQGVAAPFHAGRHSESGRHTRRVRGRGYKTSRGPSRGRRAMDPRGVGGMGLERNETNYVYVW